MYKVSNSTHEQYGKVVVVERSEEGDIQTPFFAMQAALTSRRLWKEQEAKNIRFLVDGQVMTSTQMDTWAREEYHSLPKCGWCVKILNGEVHTHRLGDSLFCSPDCADRSYHETLEKLKDEEDIEY